MKFYKIENNKEIEIKTKSKNNRYYNRYTLRNELGEDNKDINWYNSIYSKPNFTYKPRRHISYYIIMGVVIIFLGLIFFLANIVSLYISMIISLLILITIILKDVIVDNNYLKRESDDFNNLKIKEYKDEWINKNSNGKRFLVFKQIDCDEDHRVLELTNTEYIRLKIHRYEIDNFINFIDEDYLYTELYNKAEYSLYVDLPKEDYSIYVNV